VNLPCVGVGPLAALGDHFSDRREARTDDFRGGILHWADVATTRTPLASVQIPKPRVSRQRLRVASERRGEVAARVIGGRLNLNSCAIG